MGVCMSYNYYLKQVQDGLPLEAVPDEMRIPEVCIAAVRQRAEAIQFVPKECMTTKMILTAIDAPYNNKSLDSFLQIMSTHYYNSKLCIAEKKKGFLGSVLQIIDKQYYNSTICMAVVKKNGYHIKYVPKEFITGEMILIAIHSMSNYYDLNLGDFDKKHYTYELCLATVKRNAYSIGFVPEEFMTNEMVLAAVNAPYVYCNSVLYEIDKKYYTSEVCMAAVTKNGFGLGCVPENLQTPEVIEAALSSTEWALSYIKNTETRRKYIRSYGKISKEVQRDLENNKLL